MSLIEVVTSCTVPHDPARMLGSFIDIPKVGDRYDGRAMPLVGWALSPKGPPIAIEIMHRGLVVRRIPSGVHRPDVASAYPIAPNGDKSGFQATLPVLDLADIDLELRAVLADQTRVTIGHVRAERRWRGEGEPPLFSIIIPCFNQARFLGEALQSVLDQTYPSLEVIVVDDGSTDNAAAVARGFPGVVYIRQDNAGRCAARNVGLRQSSGKFVIFLDADDRLTPRAVECALKAFADHPECGFVYGAHRLIDLQGKVLEEIRQKHVSGNGYQALLQSNFIAMLAAVTWRREALETVGSFNESREVCEDYELYLKTARQYPLHHHPEIVAEYRQHGTNTTCDPFRVLSSALDVLKGQRKFLSDFAGSRSAYRRGGEQWRETFGPLLVQAAKEHRAQCDWVRLGKAMWAMGSICPRALGSFLGLKNNRWALPAPGLNSDQAPAPTPPRGRVQFGDLRRTAPISRDFGYDRGKPIDRHYIETFIARHVDDIAGRVLEIGDAHYTRAFGNGQVTQSDVLHVRAGNPAATIVADLASADNIPSDSFDCIIFTQTLHLIFDVDAAVRTLHRILKPGGVLLATLPGISPIARDEWGEQWYWGFTSQSARQLFGKYFQSADLQIQPHGSVLSAVAMLHGLCVEELSLDELNHQDVQYEVTITVRAAKAPSQSSCSALGVDAAKSSRDFSHSLLSGEDGHAMPQRDTGGLILVYHRIAEPLNDPWQVCVSPKRFDEHLRILRHRAEIVTLDELVRPRDTTQLARRPRVAITFDDGYADNLETARPILDRYHVPATFFIPSDSLQEDREFWWDALERMLLRPGHLPGELRLTAGHEEWLFKLDELRDYSAAMSERIRRWSAQEPAPTERHKLYLNLYHRIRPLPAGEKDEVIRQLIEWARLSPDCPPEHRRIGAEGLRALAASSANSIGSHTATHAALTSLFAEEQHAEISAGRRELEQILDRPITAFAYPFGEYNDKSLEILRDAGIGLAVTTAGGCVKPSDSWLELPRVHVPDCEAPAFEDLLAQQLQDSAAL